MSRAGSVIVLVTLLVTGGHVVASDWPEFRGPTGQGVSDAGSLPVSWDRTKSVVWRAAIPGRGWSQPVVHGGRVYLTTAVRTRRNQSLRAVRLDAKTGKISWNVEVFRHGQVSIHNKNSHASATPVVDGGRLYVHFGAQGTACLDLEGRVIWRNRELRYDSVHGNGGSPVLAGSVLVVNCDGGDVQFVVALDRHTGKIKWKKSRPPHRGKGFSFSTPLSIEVDGKTQLVSPASDWVVAYDPEDGREIWRVHYQQHGYSVVPRPLYGHGLVFVCTGFNSPSLLAIRPDGQGDVTKTHVAWITKEGIPKGPTPVLVGDEIYMVNDGNIASCLDARTGKRHWRARVGGRNHSASLVYGDGKIYFQSEEGEGTVIKAGKKFVELSRNPLRERSLASYAIADGSIFIRTEKHLYRIGKSSRKR